MKSQIAKWYSNRSTSQNAICDYRTYMNISTQATVTVPLIPPPKRLEFGQDLYFGSPWEFTSKPLDADSLECIWRGLGLFQNDPLKKTYVIGFCQTRLFWKPEELSKARFNQDLPPQLWRSPGSVTSLIQAGQLSSTLSREDPILWIWRQCGRWLPNSPLLDNH